jgi:hypothetical protein
MNDNPHALAIAESKLAQVRTRLEHNSFAKAASLLAEVQIFVDDLRSSLGAEAGPGTPHIN